MRIFPGTKRSLHGLLWIACVAVAANAQHAATDPVMARQMHDALALAEKQPQQALQIVTVLIQQHPGFAPALKLQGMILEDSGNADAAASSYASALKLAPADPDLQLKVGISSLIHGDSSRSVDLLSKRAKVLPRDDEGLYYLAQAYHLKGDDELALKMIRRAATLAPSSAPIEQKYGELLCSSGDNIQALHILGHAQSMDPTLPRINYDLAVASYNNFDLDQAVAFATKETQQQAGNLDAFTLLAAAEVKLNKWSTAAPVIEQVLAARPEDPSLLMQLGRCQLELHQDELAVATLQHALQADPTQPLAHFLLSRAYTALGEPDQARHEVELHQLFMQAGSFEVSKAQQVQESALSDRARVLLASNRENDALQVFMKDKSASNASAASPYTAVGALYLSMGNTEAADRMLRHALQLDPKSIGTHSYLGFLALEQGDLAGAEQYFNAELNADPNHPFALAELGEVRYRQDRWADAISFFVRSKTSFPRFLYMLVDSYFHAGNLKAADLTAESMAAFARNQPEVMQHLVDLLIRNGQTELAQRLQHP